MLPALPNSDDEAAWWSFEKVLPEFSLGLIRPDVVAYFDGEPILIEIAVTHFIDQDKLKKIEIFKAKCLEIDLSKLFNSEIEIPSIDAKKQILENLDNRKWIYPAPAFKVIEENNSTLQVKCVDAVPAEIVTSTAPKWQDYKFKINGIFVNVRKFSSGMISVNSTYNPEIIKMFKEWMREGRGSYNPKYKSWNYWLPFSEVIFERLSEIDNLKK